MKKLTTKVSEVSDRVILKNMDRLPQIFGEVSEKFDDAIRLERENARSRMELVARSFMAACAEASIARTFNAVIVSWYTIGCLKAASIIDQPGDFYASGTLVLGCHGLTADEAITFRHQLEARRFVANVDTVRRQAGDVRDFISWKLKDMRGQSAEKNDFNGLPAS